jgi:hypothetical protein
MTTREGLHRLVDELPEPEWPAAERLLAGLRDGAVDPLRLALLLAPTDDEPETPEERAAVQVARDELARGEGVADAEVWRRPDAPPAPELPPAR